MSAEIGSPLKKLFLLFIIHFSLFTATYAAPLWYHNLTRQTSSYYVGYGQGNSETEAKNAALNDIANQISIIVDTERSSHLGLKDDELSKDFSADSTQISHAHIYGYEVLKLEYEKGRYYIAVGYENIPSIDKFNKKLSHVTVDKPEVYNPYLQQTPIAKKLIKNVNFALKRKDGIWYIRYRDIFQPLDERDFSYFFVSTTNPNLSITTSKHNDLLHNGDEFYFKVTSKKSGYVTIFTVYEDGTVATLIRNVPVRKDKMENIPDKEFESALRAGLIEKGVETFDLYVVVYSKNKKHFDSFARADEALIDDERYKNFDELIALLNKTEFVTLKVVTKP